MVSNYVLQSRTSINKQNNYKDKNNTNYGHAICSCSNDASISKYRIIHIRALQIVYVIDHLNSDN